jgi:autotransporter-associated beta strand protein
VALVFAVAGSAHAWLNETVPVTVGSGNSETLVAQTGTGVVDKAGAGLLILQDPGLFNGIVRLREGGLEVLATGTAGAARPDAVFSRATFHVDASDLASLSLTDGAVSEWRDVRGAGHPSATAPGRQPLWLADALNGLPVVDFGPMAFHSGELRGMRWSRELTNSVRSVFSVLGSQFGGGFLLGASAVYPFHRGLAAGLAAPLQYMLPGASIINAAYLPNFLRDNETQVDSQPRNPATTGFSGAFHLVSILTTNTAASGATAGRFAMDRGFDLQSGGQSLAEVVVFEETLSPAERDAVTAFLTDKWFRGADLRVLELAGTGTVTRAGGAPVRINVLGGGGRLLTPNNALFADTVKPSGSLIELAGGTAYTVGLLRGSGSLSADAPVRLNAVGLFNQSLTLDAAVTDSRIDTLFGKGAFTLPGGVALDSVYVNDSITVTNGGGGLSVGFLAGANLFTAADCGPLSVETLFVATNLLLTVNGGANPVTLHALTGSGTVRVVTTGAVTVDDVSGFSGSLEFAGCSAVTLGDVPGLAGLTLENCGPFEILSTGGAALSLNSLTLSGTAQLLIPGGTLTVNRLTAQGSLTLTNALSVAELSMPQDLTITDGGTGPLLLERFQGPGNLSIGRGFYAPVVALAGSQTLVMPQGYNQLAQLSGTGTLVAPGTGAFTVDALVLDGSLTLRNSGQPLAITTLTGNGGRLATDDSPVSLSTVSIADLQSASVDAGTATVTVAAFSGYGAFRKNGAGGFTFPVPATLRNLAVAGGTLNPVRESAPTIPASVVPAFWVDASVEGTVRTNAQGGVTQWWDVRKADAADSWIHAYSANDASAPWVRPASANGLPVVDFGVYQSGHYLRWSAVVNPVRTFFMALQDGGGYLLGCSTVNDFLRSNPGSYRSPLWNLEKLYTRYGRSYVDGEAMAPATTTPFNGGFQVLSFVDDTTVENNPGLQRGRADQFSRYTTENTRYTAGPRLGEVLICTNVVTEAERAAIEKYLTAKWVADIRRLELLGTAQLALGADETLSVDVACGAGQLIKTGAGTLKVSNSALLTGGLDVRGGTLAFARTERTIAADPAFQLDASAVNGSVMTNQYGYVTNWADVRFNGRSASIANNNANTYAPNLLLDAIDGKPVIDFNYYAYGSGLSPVPNSSTPSYRMLLWDREINSIRTVFWLFGSQNGGGFLLGHSSKYEFHREIATLGDSPSPGLFASTSSEHVRNGRIFVDSLKLDSYNQRDVLNGGYQLIQVLTTGNTAANQFSRDRTSTTQIGGQRLGEVVIYDVALAEKERMNTEAQLSAKWFGDLRRVTFSDGAVFNTGGGTATVTVASLAGSGTVRREGAAPLRLTENAAFSGVLETRLDKLDVSRKLPPDRPAPNPVLWLDASRADGFTVSNATSVATIRDFSTNNLPITLLGGSPTLLPDELNGHPVIDLGPCLVGGKALQFDGTRAPVLSAVAVHGSQSGGGDFLGAASLYPFYREWSIADGTKNPYTPIWNASADVAVRQGWTYLNGENLNGMWRGFTGSYALFSFVLTPRAPIDTPVYIAGDRGNPRGGLRFGEILLYDRVLSDAERQQTEAYLNAKWFGRGARGYAAPTDPALARVHSLGGALRVDAGRAAVLGEVSGENVAVTGGGSLALTSGGAAPAHYTATSGALTLSPTAELKQSLSVTDGLAFWVDASRDDSLTFRSGSDREVVRWADARGAGHPYAFAYEDPDQRYTNQEVAPGNRIAGGIPITPPVRRPAALNGLPVLDFGPYNGTQWLLWSEDVLNIHTVFWVVGTADGNGHLLSGRGDYNHFIRGDPTNLTYASRVLLGNIYLRNAAARIDGQPVDGTRTGLRNGYQLVSLSATETGHFAGAFAADRPGRLHAAPDTGTHSGGQQLAEVLVYTRVLTEADRAEVEAYLAWKWFGRVTPGTSLAATPHTGAQVDLAPEADLILNGVARADVTVNGNGTVLNAAEPPTVYQLNGPRVFSKGLILADGAKLLVDYDRANPAADLITVTGGLTVAGGGRVVMSSFTNWVSGVQTFPLIGYDTITGGASFPAQWRGSGAPNGATLKPIWNATANRLEASVAPSGLLLIVK